jgi:hypothetical protein
MGQGMTARELGQQVAMGGIAAASIGLIIVLLVLAGFAIAGVLSIVAAVVIVALLRLFEWESAPGYRAAYRASVVGIFGFVAWAFAIDQVLPVHRYLWDPDVPFLSHAQLLEYVRQPGWRVLPLLPTLLVRFAPGVLICSALLQRRLGYALAGVPGFLKACVVSTLAIVASTYVVAIVGVRFVEKVIEPQYAMQIFLAQLPQTAIVIVAFSLVGAIFSAIAISLVSRLAGTPSTLGPGRLYRTAVIGLCLYWSVTLLVLFVYQDAGQLDAALERIIATGDPVEVLRGPAAVFRDVPFGSYFVWQLPGLLLSAALLVTALGPRFAGPIGYLKTCLISAIAWPASLVGIFAMVVAVMVAVH